MSDLEPNPDTASNSNEGQPVSRYLSAKLYGSLAAGMAGIGGIETALGLPETVADSTFALSGAIAVAAVAALVAERVMNRNQ